MALLQERYGLSYQWSGLLLAMLSVGNLAAGFAAGMLPAHWGQRRTVLMLAGGAALGYGAMILTGSPWALLAAFTLVGVAKGTTLNTSSALIAAHARERTKCMNLIHACFATGSLLCPLFIAALGMGGLPWWAPMTGLALCGAGASGLSRPVFHIAVIGQKTLLHQHGGAVGPFHDAEALLLAYLGVGAVHDAFALSVVIGETNAVFSAQAVPGAAHFLRDALGKAHGFFRVGAPGRRGEAFKAVGLSRAFVAVGMNAQKQGSAGVGRGLCTLLDGAVLAVGARAHRRIVGVLLQKRIEGVYRLFAYFQFFDDRLRTGVEAAVSGIQRHGVGRLGLQQIRPVRVARELGR